MNGGALKNHFLRIDARSLALFRVSFGLVLLADLASRWQHLIAFYSNEGVLPNHNHLFNLRDKQDVWSVYHAFSSVGENRFAFVLTALVYVAFLVGFKTRIFHALSLALLVSLTSRNILTENVGNYTAIALLAFTLFLPLGSRFSIDALKKSLEARDEKTAEELDDRSEIELPERVLSRPPGWSPVSFAAVATLLQIAIIHACAALAHHGAPWKDGSALHYALHVDRIVTGLGATVRESLPYGVLRSWTYLLWVAEVAVPVLLLLPFSRRAARSVCAWLMIVHGLSFALLLELGLYGWSLCAAAALVIPTETWDAWLARRAASKELRRTVIYDEDCGICLWVARVLRRLDTAELLTFQGNGDVSVLLRTKGRGANAKVERVEMPAAVTPEVVESTVVAVDESGRVFTRGRAVAEIVRALPGGRVLAPLLRAPVVSSLLDAMYDRVASRRQRLSVLAGMDACGLPADRIEGGEPEAASFEVPGAVRLGRRITGFVREAGALVVFAAMIAQTVRSNPVPQVLTRVPQGKVLAAVASWPRMLARWGVLAPSPPLEDGIMVVDAQTRGGKSVDPLTGREPDLDVSKLRGIGLGQLWADYLLRIRDPEWADFQKAFKDYLAKGGPRWERKTGDEQITGLDAYWVTEASPPPRGGERGSAKQEKLFTHSRGGRAFGLDRLPTLKPNIRRPE